MSPAVGPAPRLLDTYYYLYGIERHKKTTENYREAPSKRDEDFSCALRPLLSTAVDGRLPGIRPGKQSGLVDPEADLAVYDTWLRQLAISGIRSFRTSKAPARLGSYNEALEGSLYSNSGASSGSYRFGEAPAQARPTPWRGPEERKFGL